MRAKTRDGDQPGVRSALARFSAADEWPEGEVTVVQKTQSPQRPTAPARPRRAACPLRVHTPRVPSRTCRVAGGRVRRRKHIRGRIGDTGDGREHKCDISGAGGNGGNGGGGSIEQMFASLRLEPNQDLHKFQGHTDAKLDSVQRIVQAVIEPETQQPRDIQGVLAVHDMTLRDMRRQIATCFAR